MDRIKKNSSVFTEAYRLGLFSEGEEVSQPTVTRKQSKPKKCTTMPLSAYLASRQPSPGFTSVQRGRQSRGQGKRTNKHNNNNRNQSNRNQGNNNRNNNRNNRQHPQAVQQPPQPSYNESFPNGLGITGRNAEVSKGQWSNGINAAVKNSDFEDPIHEQRRLEAIKVQAQRKLEAKQAEIDRLNNLGEDAQYEQDDDDTDQEVVFKNGKPLFLSSKEQEEADEEYAALLEKQKAEAQYEEYLAYCATREAESDWEDWWSD